MNNNFEIIGFDLGHGKTALARSSNEAEPEILEVQKQRFQITAIGYDKRKMPIIGEEAFEYAINHQIQEFEICFKQRPSKNPKYQETIKNFVKEVYGNLIKSNQLKSQFEKFFFIGHPSGWLKEEKDAYEQLMSEAGLPKVRVVPESRAAFMHALESKKFTFKQIRQGILVIDIGSSTTDLTLAFDKKAEDCGQHEYDLGASLIDKEIFKRSLEDHENRDKVDEHFKINPQDIKLCEIQCRKAKEKYFNNPRVFEAPNLYVRSCGKNLQINLDFEPKVNGQFMETILNTPLPELGGNSWKEAFRNQLKIAKQKFDKEGIKPSNIIITGGGARMDFLQEICKEVFPASANEVDTEPELCVARGLARWGRLCVNTDKFKKEIDQFLQEKLEIIVKKYFDNYPDKLADLLTDGLINEVLEPLLKKYQAGEKISVPLKDQIQQTAQNWLQEIGVRNKIMKQLNEQVKLLQKEVEQETDSICTKYNLSRGTLGIKPEAIPLFNQELFSNLRNLNAEPTALATSLTTVTAIFFGGATFTTIIFLIEMVLELELAVITGGLSTILSAIFLAPKFRKMALKKSLSDEKIKETIQEEKPKLRKKIKEELDKKPELADEIVQVTKEAIKAAVEEKADDARMLLQ